MRRFNKMYKKYNQTAVPPIDLNLFRKLSRYIVKKKNMLLFFSVNFQRRKRVLLSFPRRLDRKQFMRYTMALFNIYVKPIIVLCSICFIGFSFGFNEKSLYLRALLFSVVVSPAAKSVIEEIILKFICDFE